MMHLAPTMCAAVWLVTTLPSHAQTVSNPIGSVSTADAVVANAGGGTVEVSAGRAVMLGSSTVTARDHTAVVDLRRGGELRICQSTGMHLTAASDDSLQLALDRGAMELRTKARTGDVLITPDLRLTVSDLSSEADQMQLEMRVTVNGDTCVNNAGNKAPTLKITDAFGETNYELKPGQHVLFEHGSLREVVDRETTPCGCPPDETRGMSLADAALAVGAAGPTTPAQAAALHPFPAAISEGLAEPAPPPPEASGQTHVQVGSTLAYDPNASKPGGADSAPPATPRAEAAIQPEPQKTRSGGPFAAIGRFFKRLFGR